MVEGCAVKFFDGGRVEGFNGVVCVLDGEVFEGRLGLVGQENGGVSGRGIFEGDVFEGVVGVGSAEPDALPFDVGVGAQDDGLLRRAFHDEEAVIGRFDGGIAGFHEDGDAGFDLEFL